MRLTRQKRNIVRILDIAPMIDVVMLLLIFFMCTTTFVQPEKSVDAQVAKLEGSGRQESVTLEPIEIRLSNSGGNVVIFCDITPCGSFEELAQVLAQRRKVARVDVIVKGHSSVPFGYMVSAVDTCYSADFPEVAFSTKGAFE